VAFLRSYSTSHVDVEGKEVRARWSDRGEWQSITIHAEGRAPGQPLRHNDKVALQAVTGKTEAALLLHGIAPLAKEVGNLPSGLSGVEVQAAGEPEQPLWTLRRSAGEGEVLANDEVTFEADGLHLSIVNGWAVALRSSSAESRFKVEIKDPPMPMKVGFKGTLCEGFEDVEWFGRGPHESYCDRYVSARFGRFKDSILNQTFKYVRPQENGNKLDTRWMALTRAAGQATACAGLLISARQPSPALGMQCHRFRMGDFDGGAVKEKQAILHAGELVESAETDFCVDVAQMGVGGIDSWGRRPLPEHMIKATEPFDWEFSLRPFGQEEVERSEALGVLARSQV